MQTASEPMNNINYLKYLQKIPQNDTNIIEYYEPIRKKQEHQSDAHK